MIFRIDGEVGELLALTPVIREWHVRNPGGRVLVETAVPEIFAGNPDVELASQNILEIGDYYDMNFVRWREASIAVAETYAQMVLGDKNLASWKIEMACSDAEMSLARSAIVSAKPKAAVKFDESVIGAGAAKGVIEALEGQGYEVFDVGYGRFGSWGAVYAAIGMADLFVGSDGDTSAIALATKTPAVVCYSYRSPVYFPPYRGSIPFEALVPSRAVCEHAPVCHARHSHVEFAKFYSQGCVMQSKFCCRDRELREDVLRAITRFGDQA